MFCREILNNQKAELQKTLNMKELFDKKEIEFKKVSAELREQVIELREANVSSIRIESIENFYNIF